MRGETPPCPGQYDTPRREAAAIADAIDFVEDGDFRVARPEKITLQRMDVTIFDCAIRGDQSLTNDLPTKYPLGALLGASSTKQVELDLFEIEQFEERVQVCRHWKLRQSGARGRQGT